MTEKFIITYTPKINYVIEEGGKWSEFTSSP